MASTKGEFQVRLNSSDYTFKLGTSALIELQEVLKPPDVKHVIKNKDGQEVEVSIPSPVPKIEEILIGVQQGRLKYVRAFLWAGLQKYHSGKTLEDVSDLIDEASEAEVAKLLRDLGMTVQPDPADVAELSVSKGRGKDKRPRKARRPSGTGANSTSQPEPPALSEPSLTT